MSEKIDISNLITQFNNLLNKLFETLYFCQHDSEYRIINNMQENEKISNIMKEIDKIAGVYPDLVDHVYIHSENWYKLTEYSYSTGDEYASHKFFCIEAKKFDYHLLNNNKSPKDYLINRYEQNKNDFSPKKTFKSNKQKDKKKIFKYKLPDTIDKTCNNDVDEYGWPTKSFFNVLSEFTFIDGIKLKNECIHIS